MRLSHRRKLASKRGQYWPAPGRINARQAQAIARLVNRHAYLAREAGLAVEGLHHFQTAIHSFCHAAKRAWETLKTWALSRDASPPKLTALKHVPGKIVIEIPQKDYM